VRALPPDLTRSSGDHLAGLICPDCGGNLVVSVLGESHLHFLCRVGHSYALVELLAAKEERLENALWAAVFSLEEMAALLDDALSRLEGTDGVQEAFARRRDGAAARARQMRDLITGDQPLPRADPRTQAEPEARPRASRRGEHGPRPRAFAADQRRVRWRRPAGPDP
jgi:hypothetical protein